MAMIRFAVFTAVTLSTLIANAQDMLPSASDAERLGLEVKWNKSAENFDNNFGSPGAAIWPDSKELDEYIILRSGKRIIATINAKQKQTEYARYGVFANTGSRDIAKLGIDGARQVAAQIVKEYKILGRPIEMEEVIKPKTHLCVVTDRGSVELFDAENGTRVWGNAAGTGRLPVVGPAINDEIVAVLCGNEIYVFDKITGQLATHRKLAASVSAMPVAVKNNIFVPQVDGSLEGYDRNDLGSSLTSLRFTHALRHSPVSSADGKFMAWVDGHYVYFAENIGRLKMWNRVETLDEITSTPTVVSDGLVVTSKDGTVMKVTYNRSQPIVWRENIGGTILDRPLCNDQISLVRLANGRLVALSTESGQVLWETFAFGLESPLAIGKRAAYFQTSGAGLIAVDLVSGSILSRVDKAFAIGVRNDYSDRIYLRATNGQIMCLHEVDQVEPQFAGVVNIMRGGAVEAKKKPDEPPALEETMPNTPAGNDPNPFGAEESPFGSDASGDANPFGADSGAEAENPFGDEAASENPFAE
jgi:outer membrane protein assembly factor BamB